MGAEADPGELLGDLVGVAAAGPVTVGPDNTGCAGQEVLGELASPLAGASRVRCRHKAKLVQDPLNGGMPRRRPRAGYSATVGWF